MSNSPSNMLPLGTLAPSFELYDSVSGQNLALDSLKGNLGTVIMFICNHCPFVIHVNPELVRMAKTYKEKGISFIAISSNDVVNYPQDGPEFMTQIAKDANYTFPYLFDKTQEVAMAYDAACTPDFYVFNKTLELVYRGQLDDSRPGNKKPLNGIDLRTAINSIIEGTKLNTDQKPSMGCNIKWIKNS